MMGSGVGIGGNTARLERLLGWLVGGMLLVIVAAVFLQVLFRYLLRSPLSWSEELARYLFVWSGYLGAALATMRGTHFAVDLLTVRFPAWLQRALVIVLDLVFAALFAIIARQSLRVLPVVHLQESASMAIPMSWAHAGILASSLLMSGALFARAWRGVRGVLSPLPARSTEPPA